MNLKSLLSCCLSLEILFDLVLKLKAGRAKIGNTESNVTTFSAVTTFYHASIGAVHRINGAPVEAHII